MSVTITALQAENVKRIKAVQIAPLPTGLTILGGNNNQGKTSILDAIAWALGGEKHRPAAAARDGAISPPSLRVVLSNGIVVERKGKNGSLTVTDPTGKRAGQTLLNEFVEQLALDLPKFMTASDKEKADTLLQIIGVGEPLAMLDQQIKATYDKRKTIGQIATQKRAHANELPEYPDAPAEPVSALDLIKQQQDILARNGENQRKRQQLSALKDKESRLSRQVEDLTHQLEIAEHELSKAQQDLQDAQKSAEDLQDESTAEIEQSLAEIEETNRQVSVNREKSRAEDEAAAYGKGYTYAKEEFAKLLDRLEEVIESGRNVVITAHSQIVHVEQPDAVGSYDRWTMKTSKQVAPLLREWSDMLLFANYKVLVEKSGTGANAKNKATGGRRVMYTTHHACWDAKNRFGLPEELPFEYTQIANVVASAAGSGEKWTPKVVSNAPAKSDPIMVDDEPQRTAPAPKPQTTQPAEKKAPETPAADPQPAPKSVQQIEADVSKKIAAELSALNYPPALRDLMAADRIDDAMLRHAIHQRGIYPEDMEVPKYSKVVLDNLVSKWHDAWLPFIRENSDIPF